MYIWKKICEHLDKNEVRLEKYLCAFGKKDLLGILQFAFMPPRPDNDAGPGIWR